MPLLMQIYTIVFSLLLLMNILYWIKKPQVHPLLFIYELLSGIYMISMIIVYWYPSLRVFASALNIIPFVIIMGIDFYLSIWGQKEDMGIDMEGVSEGEMEAARTISILVASPAYITGALLCYELI